MSELSIKVVFDPAAVKVSKMKRVVAAQIKLDQQALKDSNYYIPKREGFLERSSIAASLPGSGLLVWAVSYAKRMYHALAPSKKINPNASAKWFERAKATKLKEWEALANNEYSR